LTTFLLVRHATSDTVGREIAGRRPGVHLNPAGRRQAERLADRVARVARAIDAIYTSPLERARETAAPLAERLGLAPRELIEVNEIDFGEWTGRTFAELQADPRWGAWNAFRSRWRAPGGETIVEVQARMVGAIAALCGRHPGREVVVVSHGDPLKTVLAHFAGAPLDFLPRIELSPASLSVLTITEDRARILGINDTGEIAVGA
jgi:broad specificity phosphatase PhoE